MTNTIAPGALGLTGIALTWGFLVTALIAAIGGISGAHINPAVTVALAVAGRHPVREVAPYILVPCAGAAVVIGMAVALDVLMGGPLTGASMNPARSLGPALVGGRWASLWIYWVALVAGMSSAVVVLRWLRGR